MAVIRRFGWTAGLASAYTSIGVLNANLSTSTSYRHLTNTGLGSGYGLVVNGVSMQLPSATGRWMCCDAGRVSDLAFPWGWCFTRSGTPNFTVLITAAGGIELRRGPSYGTVVASAPAGTLVVGNFYWFSVEMTCATSGGTCNVYLGTATTPVVTYTGNTADSGTAGWDGISCQYNNWRWNDVVVDDANRWAEFFSIALTPTSDSSSSGFTPSTGATNYGVVDEVPWSTTDYTSGIANNDEFRCGHGSLPAGVAPVGATLISYFARDGTIADINLVVSSGGTAAYGGPQAGGSSGVYGMFVQVRDTDPNTGSAWSAAAINASVIGARIET